MNKKKTIVLATTSVFAVITIVLTYIVYVAISSQPEPQSPIEIPTGIHDPDTVRKSKTYETSTSSIKTTVKLGSDYIPAESGQTYLMLSLEGLEPNPEDNGENEENDAQLERPPLNLALVLDRSGSMSGEKLENVKSALISITDMLEKNDRITLVTYSDNVETLYSSDTFQKDEFLSVVEDITSEGSTYLEGGLREGISEIKKASNISNPTTTITNNENDDDSTKAQNNPQYVNRVILLSDGLANRGVSNPEQLAEIVEDLTAEEIVVSTIGVGTDYDENLMGAVGIAGNGNYYFMEDSNQADEIFAQEFESITNLVAQNIKIEFNMNDDFYTPTEVGEYNSNSSSTQSNSQETSSLYEFSINDIFSGKTSTFLFEMGKKENLSEKEDIKLTDIKITYKNTLTGETEEITIPITATIVDSEVNVLADNTVYETYFDLYIAKQMWQIHKELDEHKNSVAEKTLDELVDEVQNANVRTDGKFDDKITELKEQQEFVSNLETNYVNESAGGKSFQKTNQSESYDQLYNR